MMKKGIERLSQEALQQDVTDHLGRGHCERHPDDGPHRVYRTVEDEKQTCKGRQNQAILIIKNSVFLKS